MSEARITNYQNKYTKALEGFKNFCVKMEELQKDNLLPLNFRAEKARIIFDFCGREIVCRFTFVHNTSVLQYGYHSIDDEGILRFKETAKHYVDGSGNLRTEADAKFHPYTFGQDDLASFLFPELVKALELSWREDSSELFRTDGANESFEPEIF